MRWFSPFRGWKQNQAKKGRHWVFPMVSSINLSYFQWNTNLEPSSTSFWYDIVVWLMHWNVSLDGKKVSGRSPGTHSVDSVFCVLAEGKQKGKPGKSVCEKNKQQCEVKGKSSGNTAHYHAQETKYKDHDPVCVWGESMLTCVMQEQMHFRLEMIHWQHLKVFFTQPLCVCN